MARLPAPFLRFLALLALASLALACRALPSLDLQVDLDPASRRFKAVALVTPAERNFVFILHQSLAISAASAGGKPLRLSPYGRDGEVRGWRAVLPAGTDQVRLEYGGTLPALDADLDHRQVLKGLPPMAGAQGSFLPAGSGWYPQPGPLFSYNLRLSLPADQRGLVPGRLQAEEVPTDAGSRYRASFSFPHPVDGIDFMAGPWVVQEKMQPRAGAEPVRLRTYFYRDLDATPGLAAGYLEDTGRYVERYSREIGPYPFSEFSVVASPLPTGFGMPGLTYLGAQVLKLPFIRASSLGHEVLHSWWGNGVYVDYGKGNWSEGLTTFMADYAYKEDESAAAARDMRLAWLRDFAAVPAGQAQPLAAFQSRTHGAAAAVGYGKGAMVFFMLRDLIGEEAFRRGLQDFWRQYRFQAASWDHLKAAFEKASGRSLQGFFQQWLQRPGGPEIRVTGAEAGPGGLTVALEQGEPAYALHVPVEITYGGRSETRWLDFSEARNALHLPVDAQATGLRLDPDLRLWRRLEAEQLPPILRQWIISPAPRLAVAASSPAGREAAEALARRFLEKPATPVATDRLPEGSGPVLLAGLHADVDAFLARAGFPPRPANLADRGSAQVWTIANRQGPPLAVISARDAEALRALQGPLPHYGSQSWLVFEGSRALAKGVWPAAGPLLPVRYRP